MLKRGMIFIVAAAVFLFVLAACDSAKPPQKAESYTTYTDPIMGISINLPQQELTSRTISYTQLDLSKKTGEYLPKEGTSLVFQPDKAAVPLFVLQYYDENSWDAWVKKGISADKITGMANTEEVGRKGGVIYVYAAPQPNETGMDDDTKKEYERVLTLLPTIRQSIALMYREAADTGTFPSFSTTDLNGNAVSSESFAKYRLTMVNFWGTFCGPCIEEMPDLEKLNKSMPEGTRLVGIVTDVSDDENKETAKQIIAKAGATYENWLPDEALLEYMDSHVSGVPTTLFIDSNGQIVGEAVVGKRNAEKYQEELEARLSTLLAPESSPSSSEPESAESSELTAP